MIKYMKDHRSRLYTTMVLTIEHIGQKCQEVANLSIIMMMMMRSIPNLVQLINYSNQLHFVFFNLDIVMPMIICTCKDVYIICVYMFNFCALICSKIFFQLWNFAIANSLKFNVPYSLFRS